MIRWLNIGLGALAGAFLIAVPACQYGAVHERRTAEIEAARNAAKRILTLEKNNAEFKNLSPRDKCIVFMRDSGMPDTVCH